MFIVTCLHYCCIILVDTRLDTKGKADSWFAAENLIAFIISGISIEVGFMLSLVVKLKNVCILSWVIQNTNSSLKKAGHQLVKMVIFNDFQQWWSAAGWAKKEWLKKIFWVISWECNHPSHHDFLLPMRNHSLLWRKWSKRLAKMYNYLLFWVP